MVELISPLFILRQTRERCPRSCGPILADKFLASGLGIHTLPAFALVK